jgi:hypothetical protein
MCIYCTTTNYRKIYESHTGIIPKEPNGRTYEIHHIDGNHSNNNPSNLRAVTLQEHYDIHYDQGDWYACWKIGAKMKLSPEEISNLASKSASKRVTDGTHNFLGKNNPSHERVTNGTHNLLSDEMNRKRVDEGTHHFLKDESGNSLSSKRVTDGTHNFLGDKNSVYKKIKDGTHHFFSGEIQGKSSRKRVKEGTHNFIGKNNPNNPAKIRCSCIWCRKETSMPILARDHNADKCKQKN